MSFIKEMSSLKKQQKTVCEPDQLVATSDQTTGSSVNSRRIGARARRPSWTCSHTSTNHSYLRRVHRKALALAERSDQVATPSAPVRTSSQHAGAFFSGESCWEVISLA